MSIIIDAIKRAQQLRLKELKGVYFYKESGLKGEKKREREKNILFFMIAGLGVFLLLFFFGSNLLSLLISHQREIVVSVDRKEPPIHRGTKNEFQEPRKEGVIKKFETDKFSVQSGAFSSKKNAQTLFESLKTSGNKCSLYEVDNLYKVSCGEFLQESDAYLLKRELSASGYRGVFVVSLANETSKTMEAYRVAKQSLQHGAITSGKKSTKPADKNDVLIAKETVKKPSEVYKKTTPKRESTTPPLEYQKREPPSMRPIDTEHAYKKDRSVNSDVLTNFNMGVDFYRHREISKAIQAYQKVIELDPTYVEAYNNLGIIYQDIGNFEKAFEAYQESININPRYEKAYNNLGVLLFLNNRYEESIEAFQKAIAINPNNIESHINLGILFKKQGQFEKAIECYQKALAINPFHGEAHYNIGLLYEQLENFKLAIDHYQKFIRFSSVTHPDLVLKVQRHIDYLIAIKGGK